MKEKELRKIAKCALCGKKFGHTGIPMFFRVKVERYGLNASAIKRQQGLGMMIGAPLAQIMGPDEDLADSMGSNEFTVCFDCSTDKMVCVASLEELKEEKSDEVEETA